QHLADLLGRQAEEVLHRDQLGALQRLGQPQPRLVDHAVQLVPPRHCGERARQDVARQQAQPAAGPVQKRSSRLRLALAQALDQLVQVVDGFTGHGPPLGVCASASVYTETFLEMYRISLSETRSWAAWGSVGGQVASPSPKREPPGSRSIPR